MDESRAALVASRVCLGLFAVAVLVVIGYLELVHAPAMRAYERHVPGPAPAVTKAVVLSPRWLQTSLAVVGLALVVLSIRYLRPWLATVVSCCAVVGLLLLLIFHGLAMLLPVLPMSPSLH